MSNAAGVRPLHPIDRERLTPDGSDKAELWDQMLEVAKANGFDSITDAITQAVKCRERAEPGGEVLEAVDFYEREFYPLSNFSAFRILWRDVLFDTSEAAYHWEKFEPMGSLGADVCASILHASSAHEALKFAERYRPHRRPDWDDIKVGIMRQIIRAKAEQHEYVRRKLLETGDRLLIEGSWRDDFWGIGPNKDGQNMLGKLWMELRDELRALSVYRTRAKEETR